MASFFSILYYFRITPREFFSVDAFNPAKLKELTEAAEGFSDERLKP